MKIRSFPFYRQIESPDCGLTCLRMVAKFYGKAYSLESLSEKSYAGRQGASMSNISDAAESIGLRSTSAVVTYDNLIEENRFPVIVHWRHHHMVVLYRIDKKQRAHIADPAHGIMQLSRKDFIQSWSGAMVNGEKEGMILLFEPSPEFYQESDKKDDLKKKGIKEIIHYLIPYKRYIVQLIVTLLAASILQFTFPFLTQSVVDIGIRTRNISFINLVLLAQLALFLGRTAGDFMRSWMLLHMGSRINISMISDFLAKLTRLPVSYFDGKMTGDLMQRVTDHQRVQNFLTGYVTNTLFSVFQIMVFASILLWYDLTIFAVFVCGSALFVLWITMFLRRRRNVDHRKFEANSANQSGLIQFIQGMEEIKMNNAEKQYRWKWERVQAKLFKVNIKGLALEQYQQIGSLFINEAKNILITFISAKAVISGDITLGMMLSISYIIGQLNNPVMDIVYFIRGWQDASISLERVGEIFSRDDEESPDAQMIMALPPLHSINLENVSFRYGGPKSPMVLKNISLTIPQGKVTAIVGASGSGKTTLMKLLLRFYDPLDGKIRIGSHGIDQFTHSSWRKQCGAVMQDGFIFSDTIAKNIAVADEVIDREKLLHAVKVANIQSFIEELPLNYNTKIGSDGMGISGGQRQRILIARAVYKNPEYIFFDEATSALDAENEKVIMHNLDFFLKGRTSVIIAHRLSTVKNADQIIVLNKGEIVEQGNHEWLTKSKGAYYRLVRNQLELD